MNSFSISLPAVFAAFSLVCAVSPVHADEVQTRMVQTADLDLHTAAGAATLRHRVRVAARHVCGEPAQFGTPEGDSFNACVEQAEQQAMKTSDEMIAAVRTGTRFAAVTPTN